MKSVPRKIKISFVDEIHGFHNKLCVLLDTRKFSRTVRDMGANEWEGWVGEIEATLLFVVRGEEILLIEKKRGHGAGKVNGPGGKIDSGETPLQCAVRETEEELHISVRDARKVAELWFRMSDYPGILCHVFLGSDFTGEPTETEEAVPLWVPVNAIPYARMWEDDIHWLPLVLGGETLLGKFVFEGEKMVSKEITEAVF